MAFCGGFYKRIAICYDNSIRYPWRASRYLYEAIEAVVDLRLNSCIPSVLVETKLLEIVNNSYRWKRELFQSKGASILAAEAINDVVIEYYSPGLVFLVNNIQWGGEYKNKVPYYWAQLSERAGFDISEWNIEDIES